MKCIIAKHNPLILLQAVKHYQKSAQIFTFPSLYDDFECAIDAHPLNKSLKTSLYTTKKHLESMEKRLKEMTP